MSFIELNVTETATRSLEVVGARSIPMQDRTKSSDCSLLLKRNWYAVYTCANHERRVAEQFAIRDIQHFLPQYEIFRRWKDRRILLRQALFPGYIFVQVDLRNRLQMLQVPGVVHLVGSNGTPAIVPEEDLIRIRKITDDKVCAVPHSYLTLGQRVRVKAGPLTGLEGILLRRKNKLRFVISIEMIMRSMAVEVDEANLEPI